MASFKQNFARFRRTFNKRILAKERDIEQSSGEETSGTSSTEDEGSPKSMKKRTSNPEIIPAAIPQTPLKIQIINLTGTYWLSVPSQKNQIW